MTGYLTFALISLLRGSWGVVDVSRRELFCLLTILELHRIPVSLSLVSDVWALLCDFLLLSSYEIPANNSAIPYGAKMLSPNNPPSVKLCSSSSTKADLLVERLLEDTFCFGIIYLDSSRLSTCSTSSPCSPYSTFFYCLTCSSSLSLVISVTLSF